MRPTNVAVSLTRLGIRAPRVVMLFCMALFVVMAIYATRVTNEVGFGAYFGPKHPAVLQLSDYLDEFESGLHVLFVFSCGETPFCNHVTEKPVLDLVGRIQHRLNQVSNVRRTTSLLNSPIVTAPLQTETIATYDRKSGYRFAENWESLVQQSRIEPLVVNSVISENALTTGIVVEVQSLESERLRSMVHEMLDMVPRFEEELGASIFLAGDPIWTVVSDDDLNADSSILTVMMVLVVVVVLFSIFRSVWMTVFPVLVVALLAVCVQGLIGVAGIPMTIILSALPPILMVIAITISIHFLSAYVRERTGSVEESLVAASANVGSACFWASVTTAGGFLSFLFSDLVSFRYFGLLAASGIVLSYFITFTFLSSAISYFGVRSKRHNGNYVQTILETAVHLVTYHRKVVLVVGLAVFLFLASGVVRTFYKTDFGDHSFILRSVNFIDSNLRKPMTTEVVVTIPEGKRIYSSETLELLHRIEAYFEEEPSTGRVMSFLDLLEHAYRADRGTPVSSLDSIIDSVPALMPIVSMGEGVSRFWSETTIEGKGGLLHSMDRARVSVNRSWLDDQEQPRYIERAEMFLTGLNDEFGESGYRMNLEGGLILSELAVERIRETQRSSLFSAFVLVTAALCLIFRHQPKVMFWGILLNALPVAAVLGLMGWIGMGIDPANSMVGAILLVVVVDDTIHFCLGYLKYRSRGNEVLVSLERSIQTVGEAVVTTSICLAFGFSVLVLSRWGGLVTFGFLASIGVLLALLADVFILPSAVALQKTASENQ